MATALGVHFVDLRQQTQALKPELMQAIEGVVDRADFILGQALTEFEEEFAAYCGTEYAIGVASGFSALELPLRAVGIKPGDEVITQANTFIATVSAIEAVEARPVLVDCDDQGAFDSDAVDVAVSSRTRAIIPVHLFGRIGDVDVLVRYAQSRAIAVIEDACQAHGGIWKGRRAGSFGLAGAFSFYPGKNLGAFGDGGMVTTDSAAVAEHIRVSRNYGQRVKYQHEVTPAVNDRLDTLQAAILRVKLRQLDGWNDRRRRLADAYRERLAGLPLELPPAEEGRRHVYHLFVIQVEDRDGLRRWLANDGIETGIHYPIPVHLQPAMKSLGYHAGQFPNAERLAARSLSLPMYPELSMDQVDAVADSMRRFFQR